MTYEDEDEPGSQGSRGRSPTGARSSFPRAAVGAVLLAVLLALAGLAFQAIEERRSAERVVLERFSTRASYAAVAMGSSLRQAAADRAQIARQVLDAPRPTSRDLRRYLQLADPTHQDALLTDLEGRTLAATPGLRAGAGRPAGRYLSPGRVAQGTPFVGDVVRTADGLAVPVATRFESPHGDRLVTRTAPLREWSSFVAGHVRGAAGVEQAQAYVVDGEGRVMGQAASPVAVGEKLDPRLVRALEVAPAGTYELDETQRFASASIPHSSGQVVLTAPEAAVFEPLAGGSRSNLRLLGALAIALVSAFWLLVAHQRRSASMAALRERLRDPLTGLPNRAHLTAALREASAADDAASAVIALDIDRFRRLNDSLGHECGDEILRVVARRLAAAVGRSDVVARSGGDEFIVMVREVASTESIGQLTERLRELIAEPITVSGHELDISVTFGAALVRPGAAAPEHAIEDAVAALDEAQDSGRGFALYHPQQRHHAIERMRTEHELRGALRRDEVSAHFQPIINLSDGRVAGAEALARWIHPERGLIEPDAFIPAAEESGLIVPLGTRVMWHAVRRAAAWRRRGHELVVHVNVSPRQLVDPSLTVELAWALEETGLDPSALCLEVTENSVVESADAAIRTLSEMKELGVRVALDDFGVGHSSLARIARMAPIDTVKIDRSFMRELDAPAERAVVESVVGLCATLGLTVIAEGVETERQRKLLRELEVDLAQGFLFGRPVPPASFEKLLPGMIAVGGES